MARALTFAKRRAAAFDPLRCVVVHGDAAPPNVLRVLTPRWGAEDGFVFVDPDEFLADPAYDLGVALRDWVPALLASDDPTRFFRRLRHRLANGSGPEEQAIWEWGYLERVSTGLYILEMGADDVARPFLDAAALLV